MLRAPRHTHGHEQRHRRFAVVVQPDQFPLSTWLVEQTAAVDPTRLGESVGHLSFHELRNVEAALRLVFEL